MPESSEDKLRPHPAKRRRAETAPTPGPELPARGGPGNERARPGGGRYAELAVTSNFTFLTGASHPEELVERAAELGHSAAAITDTNTLAGVVRAHVAAKEAGIPLAVGCRLRFRDDGGTAGASVLVYPTTRDAYARLCRMLTIGKRRAEKGKCDLTAEDLVEHQEGLLAVVAPGPAVDDGLAALTARLRGVFDDDRLSLGVSWRYDGEDAGRARGLARLGKETRTPLVALNEVLYHAPERRPLQDVLACIREGCTIEEAGFRLAANAERHLKTGPEMARLLSSCPGAVERTVEIGARAAAFNLDQLKYEYPVETCPPGVTPHEHLEALTWAGAAKKYPGGVPDKVRAALGHELRLIGELRYEAYFLTCHDIVEFARGKGILCQGRGGAANSAVCYCLGITAVDPARFSLLFERFISRERGEPPDIDIDFEHERREEVIQYLYRKYGRERAALTAEVITYRGRSAVRDVGKAMGLSLDAVDSLAKQLSAWTEMPGPDRAREAGLNPADPTIRRVIELSGELAGFPRHLSQHVGGFVITQGPLCELVPVENAAMADRTVIEWDKDDIDAMGMLKVDVLGLGMLTCLGECFRLLQQGAEVPRCRGAGANPAESEDSGDGHDPLLPGPVCVAEIQATGHAGVPGNGDHAQERALRPHLADAPGRDIDPVEHRGGIQPQDEARIPEGSESRVRVAGGTCHAVDDRDGARVDQAGSRDRTPADRDRPDAVCAHSQAGTRDGTEDLNTGPSSLPIAGSPSAPWHPATSTPSLFVPSCIADIPHDDPAIYEMLCHADTIGVFQVESRAQMSMLPRLKPREFYDLVVEVAIVRPGPIQGGMVHPYLKRRAGLEKIEFPNREIEEVLGRTLGVPIFQEQAMRLAIVAGGFTPDEADALRRAMAAWKRKGDRIYRFGERLIEGMKARGYPVEFAERCFEQIKGFSEYGFPESHAASFAILVYASAWLKRYHPAAFAAALINSQPMGFYQPAQIVRDAREHGVEVRPVDVNASGWDCSLEPGAGSAASSARGEAARLEPPGTWGRGGPALRLGMRLVKGLAEQEAGKIAGAVRRAGPFSSVAALWRASSCAVSSLRRLARADAFGSMGLDRQAALWALKPLRDESMPLLDGVIEREVESIREEEREGAGLLPAVRPGRRVLQDYGAMGLSLKPHPVSFIRPRLARLGVRPARELADAGSSPGGQEVAVAGVVLVRQRPATASGVVFFTLEDETGIVNLVVWSTTFERYRKVARLSSVMLARGRVEREGEVVHVHARELECLDDWIPGLGSASRDFH